MSALQYCELRPKGEVFQKQPTMCVEEAPDRSRQEPNGVCSELRKIVLTRVVFSLQPPTADSTPDFVRKMESGPSHRAAVDVIVKDA